MRHRTHRLLIEIEVRSAVSPYSIVYMPECRRLSMSRLTYIMIVKSEMFNNWAITNFYQNRRDLQMTAFSGNSSSISPNILEPLNWMSHYWKLLFLVISKVHKLGFHMQWHACKFRKSTSGPGWGGFYQSNQSNPLATAGYEHYENSLGFVEGFDLVGSIDWGRVQSTGRGVRSNQSNPPGYGPADYWKIGKNSTLYVVIWRYL